MAEVGANQRHANHGIYVLCKAVRSVPVWGRCARAGRLWVLWVWLAELSALWV